MKLPLFDGSREKFHSWWTKMSAHAMFCKFAQCLTATAEADLPGVEVEHPNDTNAQKAARKRNNLAVCSFTLAFVSENLLSMVCKSKTQDWPNGKAHARHFR